jgi:hypothetical protein
VTNDAKLVLVGLVLYALLAGFYGGRFFEQRQIRASVIEDIQPVQDFRPRPAFLRSVSIQELAERFCLRPSYSERERAICAGAYFEGARQGMLLANNYHER